MTARSSTGVVTATAMYKANEHTGDTKSCLYTQYLVKQVKSPNSENTTVETMLYRSQCWVYKPGKGVRRAMEAPTYDEGTGAAPAPRSPEEREYPSEVPSNEHEINEINEAKTDAASVARMAKLTALIKERQDLFVSHAETEKLFKFYEFMVRHCNKVENLYIDDIVPDHHNVSVSLYGNTNVSCIWPGAQMVREKNDSAHLITTIETLLSINGRVLRKSTQRHDKFEHALIYIQQLSHCLNSDNRSSRTA
jgi:hypothetical protein